MHKICVGRGASLLDVLNKLELAKLDGFPGGIILVVDDQSKLIGTITDGDIRKGLLEKSSMEFKAGDLMQKDPICFDDKESFKEILEKLPKELTKRKRRSSKYLSKIILVNKDFEPTRIFNYHHLWEQRVATHRHVIVVGLGYVGLTLSLVLAQEGFLVTGVDSEKSKVDSLKNGNSYIHEVGLSELLREQADVNFKAQYDMPKDGDVYIISVGTPVKQNNGDPRPRPVLTYIQESARMIGKQLKPGNLVVLRSTVPMGTTREVIKPILEEESGLQCGRDFHLAFAPERTAEGNALKELRELPQLIGGFNKESGEATVALFRELTPSIVRMESLEAAEMAKLINNTYRDFVFAYSNYAAQIASNYNLDVVEVIKAANKGYPRNPVPLPSPGVGGPCLTKDPFIFAAVAEKYNSGNTIFETARNINENMFDYIVVKILDAIKKSNKDPKDCHILVCGLAFKGHPETGDIRNSPSIEIIPRLKKHVKEVYGHDAVASPEEIQSNDIKPENLPMGFRQKDVVLFLNNHMSYQKIDVFNMVRSMNQNPIIFDGWHMFRPDDVLMSNPCTYLGLSFSRNSLT